MAYAEQMTRNDDEALLTDTSPFYGAKLVYGYQSSVYPIHLSPRERIAMRSPMPPIRRWIFDATLPTV